MQKWWMLTLVVLSVLAASQASEDAEPQGSVSNTWDAIKNWFSPATTYVRDTLPEKTPSQVASDAADAASDAYDRVNEHSAVKAVKAVLRPVGNWISDSATRVSNTRIQDLYDSAADGVRRADSAVAGWINGPTEAPLLHR